MIGRCVATCLPGFWVLPLSDDANTKLTNSFTDIALLGCHNSSSFITCEGGEHLQADKVDSLFAAVCPFCTGTALASASGLG